MPTPANMKIAFLVLASFQSALALCAADFSGLWEGGVESPQGRFKMTYALKSSGATLSGTVTPGEMGTFAMSEIKTEGDTIAFKVESDAGAWLHQGTLKADELSVSVTGPRESTPP